MDNPLLAARLIDTLWIRPKAGREIKSETQGSARYLHLVPIAAAARGHVGDIPEKKIEILMTWHADNAGEDGQVSDDCQLR